MARSGTEVSPAGPQLIDRVVLTYVKAGKEHGYFATDEDAEIFEHELTYALLHPGVQLQLARVVQRRHESRRKVSACFILSVDDSMDSILNWYKEEGSSSRVAPVPA